MIKKSIKKYNKNKKGGNITETIDKISKFTITEINETDYTELPVYLKNILELETNLNSLKGYILEIYEELKNNPTNINITRALIYTLETNIKIIQKSINNGKTKAKTITDPIIKTQINSLLETTFLKATILENMIPIIKYLIIAVKSSTEALNYEEISLSLKDNFSTPSSSTTSTIKAGFFSILKAISSKVMPVTSSPPGGASVASTPGYCENINKEKLEEYIGDLNNLNFTSDNFKNVVIEKVKTILNTIPTLLNIINDIITELDSDSEGRINNYITSIQKTNLLNVVGIKAIGTLIQTILNIICNTTSPTNLEELEKLETELAIKKIMMGVKEDVNKCNFTGIGQYATDLPNIKECLKTTVKKLLTEELPNKSPNKEQKIKDLVAILDEIEIVEDKYNSIIGDDDTKKLSSIKNFCSHFIETIIRLYVGKEKTTETALAAVLAPIVVASSTTAVLAVPATPATTSTGASVGAAAAAAAGPGAAAAGPGAAATSAPATGAPAAGAPAAGASLTPLDKTREILKTLIEKIEKEIIPLNINKEEAVKKNSALHNKAELCLETIKSNNSALLLLSTPDIKLIDHIVSEINNTSNNTSVNSGNMDSNVEELKKQVINSFGILINGCDLKTEFNNIKSTEAILWPLKNKIDANTNFNNLNEYISSIINHKSITSDFKNKIGTLMFDSLKPNEKTLGGGRKTKKKNYKYLSKKINLNDLKNKSKKKKYNIYFH